MANKYGGRRGPDGKHVDRMCKCGKVIKNGWRECWDCKVGAKPTSTTATYAPDDAGDIILHHPTQEYDGVSLADLAAAYDDDDPKTAIGDLIMRIIRGHTCK